MLGNLPSNHSSFSVDVSGDTSLSFDISRNLCFGIVFPRERIPKLDLRTLPEEGDSSILNMT